MMKYLFAFVLFVAVLGISMSAQVISAPLSAVVEPDDSAVRPQQRATSKKPNTTPPPKESPAQSALKANLQLDACLSNPGIAKHIAELEAQNRKLQLALQCAGVEKEQRELQKPATDAVFDCYSGVFEAPKKGAE